LPPYTFATFNALRCSASDFAAKRGSTSTYFLRFFKDIWDTPIAHSNSVLGLAF
jgi:hypothetical protein